MNAVGECGHVDISRQEQYGFGYLRERSHKFRDNCHERKGCCGIRNAVAEREARRLRGSHSFALLASRKMHPGALRKSQALGSTVTTYAHQGACIFFLLMKLTGDSDKNKNREQQEQQTHDSEVLI